MRWGVATRPGATGKPRRLQGWRGLWVIGMCLTLGLAVAGCGSPSAKTDAVPPLEDPGVVHVHGLGINPRDGVLYAATHTGLFRIPEGGRATRVGDRYQDTMGFTILGADHFLGSGHPDLRDTSLQRPGRPPLLGLVESKDAGRTWRSLSLVGEADFHDLTVTHGLVYGYDATGERLMVSRDRLRWEIRSTLAAGGFAVSPANSEVLVAASEQGLLGSTDGGRRWRQAGGPRLTFVEWGRPEALWGVDPAGQVHLSPDGGSSWSVQGGVGGEPAALLATGTALYVAVHDGRIVRSLDGGKTWQDYYTATT